MFSSLGCAIDVDFDIGIDFDVDISINVDIDSSVDVKSIDIIDSTAVISLFTACSCSRCSFVCSYGTVKYCVWCMIVVYSTW